MSVECPRCAPQAPEPEPGIDMIGAMVMVQKFRARVTFGEGYCLVERRVKDPGATDCWEVVGEARASFGSSLFLVAVREARKKLGWTL